MQAAPRCGARNRRGCPCEGPAMRNGRCRFHGGKSTGPRTAEGLRRCQTATLKHGKRSAEAIDAARARGEARRMIVETDRLVRAAETECVAPSSVAKPAPKRPPSGAGRRAS